MAQISKVVLGGIVDVISDKYIAENLSFLNYVVLKTMSAGSW